MPSFMYKNEKIGGVSPKQENIAMGNKDISSIGDGTLTGAIESLDTNKLDNIGDSKDNTTSFTSSDSNAVSEWTDVSTLTSGEKHSSIFSKMSQMFKNIRYLWKLMGTTDISSIGNGTLTGAINAVNENKLGKTETAASASKLSNTSAIGSATKPVYFNANGVPVAGTYELNKSVPSDAKFTDTTYSAATTSATGLMSATDKSKLNKITVGYLTMASLGLNGKTSSVADFFSALAAKGYDKLGVLHFDYSYANAGDITGSGITISINGCQCIITNHGDGPWQRRNAIISICDKTYNVWAQYDNGTSPTNSGIFDLTSAIKLQTARTIQTKLNSTSSASFDGTGNVTPGVTGTLPVSNGGTGHTTLNGGINAFINALDTGTSVPTGGAYFVCQDYAGGNNNVYYRRPISTIWDYIKNQMGTKGSATQPIYMNSGVPTACTYTLGKSVPSNAVFTDTNTWRPVQNNLTSTSSSDCLSANQGKILNEKINGLRTVQFFQSGVSSTAPSVKFSCTIPTGPSKILALASMNNGYVYGAEWLVLRYDGHFSVIQVVKFNHTSSTLSLAVGSSGFTLVGAGTADTFWLLSAALM